MILLKYIHMNLNDTKMNLNNNLEIKQITDYCNYLKEWFKNILVETKTKGFVVGLSGGIDSAIVAVLIQLIKPNNHMCLWMPINSNDKDYSNILQFTKNKKINLKTIDLNKTYDCFVNDLNLKNINNQVCNNIKPRLRMTTLYSYAQQNNYLVVGTSNADELYLGYFTKHGDGGCDLMPLAKLVKFQIYLIAKYLNIPDYIINKPPSAGLWEGQTDEKEFGFSYKECDNYLQNQKINFDIIKKIEYLHKRNNHKTQKIIVPQKSLNIKQ